jgi:hypothetical protein
MSLCCARLRTRRKFQLPHKWIGVKAVATDAFPLESQILASALPAQKITR